VDAVDRGVPSLTLDLPAEPASVAEAISRVREFAAGNGAGLEGGRAIALAVGEAVGNAVRHAVPGDGDVQVMLDVEEGELEFVVVHAMRGVEVWMRFPLDR
jgi:anti-sigma regulatory factor (Ser/Thr protein kinase)